MIHLFYCETVNKNMSEAAVSLLNSAVWAIFGVTPPRIEKTPNGKPFFPDMPQLFFSLSHSGDFCACALSDTPVGCDIQIIKDVSSGLIKRTCRDEELEKLDFFSLWSLKESYIKLYGERPSPLRDIVFLPDGHLFRSGEVYGRVYGRVSGYSMAVCSKDRSDLEALSPVNIADITFRT